MSKASEIGRRALSLVGRILVIVGLPLALVMGGAALRQSGSFIEAGFACFLCLIPVALGVALAELGQRGIWRETVSFRGLLQSSVGLGFVVAVTSLIAMYAYPPLSTFVALGALCLFAIVDPVLNVTRRSWWLGAFASIVVWIVLMSVLVGVADDLLHLRESTMVFLLPFMVYPVALAVSGLLRLTGSARGWNGPKTAWIAASVIALGFGAFLTLQVGFAIIPAAIEKITGNTLPNTVYSGQDGTVVAAEPGKVDVQEAANGRVPYRLTAETKFDFRGPGWQKTETPAGPSWLKPGQRVSIEYVYRQHERQASLVSLWVERTCVPAPLTASAPPLASPPPSVAGTVWEGRLVGPGDPPDGGDATRFEFQKGGVFAETRTAEDAHGKSTGRWTQDQAALFMQVNDCYARFNAVIEGETLRGTFDNEVGLHQTWTARRAPTVR